MELEFNPIPMVHYDINIDPEVFNYCDREWEVIRRIRGERKIRKRDFPPVVVSCSDGRPSC